MDSEWWPCDERTAHAPHKVTVQMLTGPEEFMEQDCPGVRAHPATMIGRGVSPMVKEVQREQEEAQKRGD